MKQKGFTLIELLAVIIVLAVIALIAVPLVMNTIENSKRGSFKESVRGLLAASEIANAQNEFQGTNYEIVDGIVSPSLEYKGSTLNLNGRFYTSNEGYGYAMISNGKYCAYKLGKDPDISIVSGDLEACKETLLAYDDTGAGLVCPTCVIPTGNVTAGDVKEGVTFWNAKSGKEEVGTLKEKTYEELKEENRLYLYKDGEEYMDVTGGWTSEGYGEYYESPSVGFKLVPVTKNKDHILLSTSTEATLAVIGTKNEINFSLYKKLCFEVDTSSLSQTYVLSLIGVYSSKEIDVNINNQYFARSSDRTILTIDISSNDKGYISTYQSYPYTGVAGSFKLYKVWLEK